MSSYFIWPRSYTKKGLKFAFFFTSVKKIEDKLQEMFPTGFPVLCSSGRSALVLALIESNVKRSDLVGIFPYANHCVLDAISRVATPLPGSAATKASLRVVYHQWGYVQETNLAKNSIEDCVDSLCVPGATLFPGGGCFEIWSLPKILGTTSGGILWCKERDDANKIRLLRDNMQGGFSQWVLRLLGQITNKIHLYWQGAECSGGKVSRFQTGEIIMAIRKWDEFVEKRRSNLDKIWPLAVTWLSKPFDRLPPVVPIYTELTEKKVCEYGIKSGFRMFENVNSENVRRLYKVLPVPIHQDVPISWLDTLENKMNQLNSELD